MDADDRGRLKLLADEACQRLEAGTACTVLLMLLAVAQDLRALPPDDKQRRQDLEGVLSRLEEASVLRAANPRPAFADLCRCFARLHALQQQYLGNCLPDAVSLATDSPPGMTSPARALFAFLTGLETHRHLIEELSAGNERRQQQLLANNAARIEEARDQLSPPGSLEAAVQAYVTYLQTLGAAVRGPSFAQRRAPESGYRFVWHIYPSESEARLLAELVYTQDVDATTGSLKISSDAPAMQSLITYYLADPAGHRPLFFQDTGTLSGPHTLTFGQIDRSLLDFSREYAGFRVVRNSPFPAFSSLVEIEERLGGIIIN